MQEVLELDPLALALLALASLSQWLLYRHVFGGGWGGVAGLDGSGGGGRGGGQGLGVDVHVG